MKQRKHARGIRVGALYILWVVKKVRGKEKLGCMIIIEHVCVYIYIIDLRIKDWVRKGLSITLFFFWWTASHFMWSSTLKSSISLLYSCHRFSLHHENLQARSLSNSFCWQIEVLIESIKVCGSLQCIQDSITLKPGIDNFNRKNSTQDQSEKWCFQSKN